jgi:hypothetical protein
MGETRWGRAFFWLASVGGAGLVGVVLLLLLMPIAIPLVVPILFAGLGGLIVLLVLLMAHPTPRPVARRRVSTRWLVLALGILAALDVGALVISVRHDDAPGPDWVRAGSVSDLQREHVVYLSEPKVFVVDAPTGPLAMSAFDPHLGERILFCRSSGWFEDPQSGSKYDGLGYYTLGPSPRGMDRVGVRVVDGDVWVIPVRVTAGPPRGAKEPEPPLGPPCNRGEGDVPGFTS